MYIDTVTGDYPLTADDIKSRFPNTSFCHPFAPPEGYADVEQTPHPDWNPVIERVVEGAPENISSSWRQTWVIEKIYLTTDQENAAIATHEAKALQDWRDQTTCTPFQGRMALADAGLLANVLTAIESADEKTKTAWEYALEWKRNSPMIATLMAALNISDSQADDLFKAASQITA